METYDVAVIGGGVIGASVALALSNAGSSVIVLEQRDGWGAGCSHANAGLIVPCHAGPFAHRRDVIQALRWLYRRDSPFALRPRLALGPWLMRWAAASSLESVIATTKLVRDLAVESLEMHLDFARRQNLQTVRRDGLIEIYETSRAFRRARDDALGPMLSSLEPRVLSPSEVTRLEPALTMPIAGGILFPNEAHGDPLELMRAIGSAAESAGTTMVPHAAVYAARRAGSGTMLSTTRGDYRGRVVVMATGAWSPRLRMLTRGSRLCVESGRGYSVDLARQQRRQIVRPLLLHEPRIAVTPLHGRLRLAGTMALDGLDPRIDSARVRAVHDVGRRAFEEWNDADVVQVWSGPRPCTPDGVPLIGWLPDQEGSVAIATGHAMLGLTLAPVTGRLIAELITGRPRTLMRQLDPRRFHGRSYAAA